MCDCMPEAIADGIDKSQEQALRSKKRSASIKTEVDKWNQIYRIIFPDDREIPSPCERTLSAYETQLDLLIFSRLHCSS